MPERNGSDEIHRMAREVRGIATGVFDKGERELLLRFVDDCEKQISANSHPTRRRPGQSAG
jgi:hypothetical protein